MLAVVLLVIALVLLVVAVTLAVVVVLLGHPVVGHLLQLLHYLAFLGVEVAYPAYLRVCVSLFLV